MNNSIDKTSWYNEENYNYIRQYILGKISIVDVPFENLNEFILTKASKKEPDILIKMLLNLNEQGNYKFDTLDSLRLVSNEYRKNEYYYRYFLLNPLEHYLKIPIGKRTKKMSEYLISLSPENIKYIFDKHKTKEMCVKVFQYDPRLVLYMPIGCVDEVMLKDYIKHMALDVKVNVNEAVQYSASENWQKYLSFLNKFLRLKKIENLHEMLFEINPLLFVAFDDEYKTYEMCNKIYWLHGELVKKFIPENILFDIIVKDDSGKLTDNEKRQYYYNKVKEDPINLIDYVPFEYRTQEMWDLVVFASSDVKILEMVPEKFITQDMCEYIYKAYGGDSLAYIPSKFINKEMLTCFFDKKLYKRFDKDLSFLTIGMLDEDNLSKFVVYLKDIIKEDKVVSVDFKVFKFIVNLYPKLIKAFNRDDVKKIIIEELYSIILNAGTIEEIANKYELSVSYINSILESISTVDKMSYDMIKNILEYNQNKWFHGIQQDVENLDLIISKLGDIKNGKLDIMQKVKFAYLYYTYIHHSLPEIYRFKYQKYTDKDYSKIDKFFKYVLKYNCLFDDEYTSSEIDVVELNNSWLQKYDRDKFFAIKNGVMTMEHRFGKESKLLTEDIEKEVLLELNLNNIPLNKIIVQCAFREYFNGNFNDYINTLKNYNEEFENIKKERGSR